MLLLIIHLPYFTPYNPITIAFAVLQVDGIQSAETELSVQSTVFAVVLINPNCIESEPS